jgi:hypothetical protein
VHEGDAGEGHLVGGDLGEGGNGHGFEAVLPPRGIQHLTQVAPVPSTGMMKLPAPNPCPPISKAERAAWMRRSRWAKRKAVRLLSAL